MRSLQSFSILASIAAMILLVGCNSENANPRVVELESQVEALQTEVTQLQEWLVMEEIERDLEKVAVLTPGTTGYSVIRMDLGNLAVSLIDISPYANGSKVTLQFGNLTSATIDGLNGTVIWGTVDQDPISYSEGKSKEFNATEPLEPGSWHRMTIVLEGVGPSSFGFVRVRDVRHRAIRMRNLK